MSTTPPFAVLSAADEGTQGAGSSLFGADANAHSVPQAYPTGGVEVQDIAEQLRRMRMGGPKSLAELCLGLVASQSRLPQFEEKLKSLPPEVKQQIDTELRLFK